MSIVALACLVGLLLDGDVIDAKPELVARIEVSSDEQYRVRVRVNGYERDVELNRLSFKVPSPGLGPVGSRVQVKRRDGTVVESYEWYTSIHLYSNLSLGEDDFVPVENDTEIVSPWYALKDLLRGLRDCDHTSVGEAREWSEYRLSFTVEFSHLWLVVESDWYPFGA